MTHTSKTKLFFASVFVGVLGLTEYHIAESPTTTVLADEGGGASPSGQLCKSAGCVAGCCAYNDPLHTGVCPTCNQCVEIVAEDDAN